MVKKPTKKRNNKTASKKSKNIKKIFKAKVLSNTKSKISKVAPLTKSEAKIIKNIASRRVKPIEINNQLNTERVLVGEVTHFYPHIDVAVVKVKKEIKLGDDIIISGHGNHVEQKVYSMQMDHQPLSIAKKNQEIGLKVAKPVKDKDLVYLKK